MLETIKSIISTAWDTVFTKISTVLTNIKTTVSSIWDSIKSAISAKITGIVTTVKDGFNQAVDFVKGLASDAWDWGADIISGIIDGIKGMIGKLTDCVTGVADTIRDFLHFSVPDRGPLTDYESWMPDFMAEGLRMGLTTFGRRMRGFVTNEAIVAGVESRTSTPVRIPRDAETLMHPEVAGLFPTGEGAGYAGGIISAGLDGERIAEAVARYVKPR